MNTKLHAICDSQGRPLDLFITARQVSDYIGARALLSSLPKVE
jgi:transposase